MIYIAPYSTNPYFNLAAEEYVFTNFSEDIFMLWQNENSIIIGKNQNTLSEIDYNFAKDHNINIVRRLSGGGAVYHDLGNINFTFITDYNKDFFSEFQIFTKPVIDTLGELGIKADLQGRNDISINGLKFSGNSQVVKNGRILHHGTIMLDVNVDILSRGLFVKKEKIESKGIKSVRKRVTNIKDHLKDPITSSEFIDLLYSNVKKNNPHIVEYYYTKDDIINIEKLKRDKYETWEWNYGTSPKYNISKQIKLSSGIVEIYIHVEKGIIEEFSIFGDFFGEGDIKEFSDKIIGMEHNYELLCDVFAKEHIERYIYSLENINEFVKNLF